MEFSAESLQKLNGLAMAVLNKPIKELNASQIEQLLAFDMMSLPSEITVSTNDTRRTEQQYCTNSYGGTSKIVFSELKELIKREVLELKDPNQMLDKYLELKSSFMQFVKFKYASTEAMLREMSRDAQLKDKIVGVGRHAL